MINQVSARAVILIVGAAHFLAGLGILVEPSARWVTSTFYFSYFLEALNLNGHTNITVGLLFVGSGLAAILAIFVRIPGRWRVRCIWPQQWVLIVQFISIGFTIVSGVYPDGYVPAGNPHVFIWTDQIIPLAVTLWHSAWMAEQTWGYRDV